VTSLSGVDPDIAAIAGYNPSLVISQNHAGLVRSLSKLGIPVLIEPEVASVPDAYAQIGQIGLATGHANQAQEVVTNMRQEISDLVQQAGAKYRGLTYYWEVSSDPYRSAASATLIGHIMDLFGLRNIADAASKPGPQIIFLADGGQTPDTVAARPGWSGIPAVRDHEIIGLNDEIASRWGPRLPQLVGEVASALKSFRS
jgi:iron complex transport system substrate-binding protein